MVQALLANGRVDIGLSDKVIHRKYVYECLIDFSQHMQYERTALDIAEEYNRSSIAALLRAKGPVNKWWSWG